MEEKEGPPPEYGVIHPTSPQQSEHHPHPRRPGFELQANGPDRQIKPIKAESSSSFLRAARAGNLDKLLEFLKGSMDINTSNANGLNALHLASKEGHVHVVRELLSRGAAVDAATKKGNTALHIASLAGQAEVVEILVEMSAKVNVQSQNGFTPLYMAAQENHSEVVKFLLANGANQTLSTEDGFTPLAVALQQGHDRVVAVLLENDSRGKVHLPALHIAAKKDDVKATTLLLQNEHNADTNKNGGLVNDTTKSGFTPLHIACHYGNVNVGRLLIDKGADVNYKARNSITPLHVAGKWGRSNMVELLLDAQANIDARTRDGLTPLHCAARSGHDQVVDLLLERGASVTCKTKNGLTPLHMSSQGDHVDCARLLLYHKAPIDEVTVDYLTPLHVVAHCGNVKTAKLLLDRKCEVNARALNGFTPLHIACKKNRIKIVELLLKYGASLEATTESGLTPLHVASFMGHMNIVVFLIQHGSNPNNTTMRGETALHLAARANQTDIIRILLRNGAQVDHAKAREQQTALHISSRLGNVDNVLLLLQHGASPDAVTKDFYTPLHIAAKEGHDEVVQVLLEHGAKQTLATKRGFTPLHVAAKYGNLKVVQMLIRRGTNPNLEGKNGLTPLHVATHYNRINVALYLLEKNASSHSATKNGYTALHIAAKKNQMDIATTLLEHGSNCDAESKNGFTPLHLAAQEGHSDMVALLAEHEADVDCSAKNGLTPLHLTAQEDHVPVAEVLVNHKANIDPQTKAGYTPLHTACHFGQIGMIRFLLDHGAAVNSTTKLGYTPLHQAAQQGHVLVINLLLKHQASPNAITSTGQTPLSIAQRLGYISVVEILKHVTTVAVDPAAMEEKYKVMFPETMQEAPMLDSEEEGGEESILVDQSFQYLSSAVKPLEDDNMGKETKEDFIFDQLSEKDSMSSSLGKGAFIDDTKYSKDSAILPSDFKGIRDDNMIMSFSECSQTSIKMEMVQSDVVPYQYASQEMMSSRTNQYDEADYYQCTSSFSGVSNAHSYETSADFSSDHSTTCTSGFLVSFMVDARGGAMRGCRHSGVRIIIPPGKACMPTRVTCRLVKREKVMHPPALMEGEALASRILEMGPVGAKFSGPVIIEVPHFASLRGKEREITVLRSENGQTWREHTVPATEEAVQEALQGASFSDLESADDLMQKRITRILTTDIPQYFAVVARVRQETSTIGPDGGMISSTVVPRVQAIFPEGSLTKNIKVGLQVQPVPFDLVSKMLGNRVAVSPIVTVEPRRRKFHKPITLTIPVPMAAQKGMLNQYGGEAPTLRLLCSIMGGTSPAQWEDITGTTPLAFINDCVSFTTTVSARFWLMDCQNVNESAKMASDLYHEIILVPFMARFVVFAKRHDAMEARLRIFCMTDDKMDKLLENREHFKHAARSVDVEVLEGKPQYIEMGGNLVPVTKSGEKLCVGFRAFRENRLPIVVRIRDFNHEASGLMAFMREPKGAMSGVTQVPICTLTIALPDYEPSEPPAELKELEMNYESIKKRPAEEQISMTEPWLTDIADSLGQDWVKLAHQMKVDKADITKAEQKYADDSKKALVILLLWIQKFGERATGSALEKALKSIGHEDIVRKCMYDIDEGTDAVERARVYLDSTTAGFDALREELGSSQGSSVPRGGISLDVSYEEQDMLKESESVADESTTTLDGNNMELASLDDGETMPGGVESSGKSPLEEESIDAEYDFVEVCSEAKWNVVEKPVSHDQTESDDARNDEPMDIDQHSDHETSEEVIIQIKVEPRHTTFSEPWYTDLPEETRLSDDETKDEDVVGNDVATRKGNDESTEEMIKSYFLRGTKITNLEGSDTLFELLGGSVLKEYEEDSVRVSNVSGMLQEFVSSAFCFKKDGMPVDDNNNICCDFDAIAASVFIHSGYRNGLRNEFLSDKNTEEQSLAQQCLGNILSKECPGKQTPDKDDSNSGDPGGEKSDHGNAGEENQEKENSGKEPPGESNNPGSGGGNGNGNNSGDGNPGNGSSADGIGGESDVQTRVEVTEDEQVLPDGTVVKRKILKRTFIKELKVASTDDSGRFSPVVLEEIVGMEIEENVTEMAPGVSEPFNEDVDSDTTTESSEYRLANGAPVKKILTRTRAWLNKQVSKEQVEERNEQDPLVISTETETLSKEVVVGPPVCEECNEQDPLVISTETETFNNKEVVVSPPVCVDAATPEMQPVAASFSEAESSVVSTADKDAVGKDVPNDVPLKSGATVSETVLPDGTTVKTQIITKVILKGTAAASQPSANEIAKEDIDRIEIEELITEMAPGISEPFDSDVEAKMTCYSESSQTPDGIPIQKNTIRILAFYNSLDQANKCLGVSPGSGTNITEKDLMFAKVVDECLSSENEKAIVFASGKDGQRVTEGNTLNEGIEVRTDVSEDETVQSDGMKVKRKTCTKTFLQEVSSASSDAKEKTKSEVIRREIDVYVTEMAPGISEPFGEDVETDLRQESFEYNLPNGLPVKKNVVTVVARRRSKSRADNPIPESEVSGIPHLTPGSKGPDGVGNVSVNGLNRRQGSSEEVQTRTEESVDVKALSDGTSVTRKIVTKTFFKERFSLSGKAEEEIVKTEIEEFVTEIGPGVSEPHGDDVETEVTQDSSENQLSNGSPVVKSRVKSVTRLKRRTDEKRPVSSEGAAQRSSGGGLFGQHIERTAAAPVKTSSENEDLEVRTEITEDENVLADGTVVKKKTTTKTTVREVQKDRHSGKLKPVPDEEIVQTEIEERIMRLAPGVSDPFGDDVEIESSTESFRYYLENGSPVVKTVVMVAACFLPRANPGGIASVGSAYSPRNNEGTRVDSAERSSRTGRMLEVSGEKKTSDAVVVNGVFNGHYKPLTHPNVAKLTTSVTARKSVMCRKVRNVGPDGSITEDVYAVDEDGFSDSSSVSDIRDLSPFAFSSTTDDLFLDEYEPGSAAIQVCTRTEDEDPQIETDVKEFEDVLPDGTVVHRIMNKTVERKTFVNHVVIHTPHPTGKHPCNDLTLDNYVEPYLAKYSHSCHGAPEVTTDTQDSEDILPDGTVSKKRVTRKTEQQLSLERTLLIGNMPSLVGPDEGSTRATTLARSNIPAHYVQGQGVQEAAVIPSTRELSLPSDEEQVSRVILRKQIHKKTIVHDGKEETVVTEDTQIEQDPNAPIELTESVQELIHQFLDSNGEPGSADSGAPD